ncbi:hypothetical protein [Flavobacterium fluviale]|uniref:Uncharacterized protein n=1 Tax=Flavobacterium fluviale TaxID=2249356 RepID=A0A344LWN4_9FLAO|nr:hypothetical protein [Flavobacterium fluviale]AXB58326.1 hypothetical protein HYN86_17680 [Flavobacterium fluviale]
MNDKKVKFESNFSLDFGATDQKMAYGFIYEILEKNLLKIQLFYEVEIDIKYLGGNYTLEINRKQIYINNRVSYSKIEEIAIKISTALFPLLIKLKPNGEIDQILNQNEIVKRWTIERKTLLEYYQGEKAAKIISKIDVLFSDSKLLLQSLAQNWFFCLFFRPLYTSYSEKLKTQYIWKFPVFGTQFIEFDVVQTVEENYSEDDKININAAGVAIDERTIDEIISGYHFPLSTFSNSATNSIESKMNADYKLYKEDRSIYSVQAAFETKIDQNTQQKIHVEIYHLTENSSYRPISDLKSKAFFERFQSWQTVADEDIIDISKPKWQALSTSKTKTPNLSHEKIELFVDVGPNVKADPTFWDWIKSIFNKKN